MSNRDVLDKAEGWEKIPLGGGWQRIPGTTLEKTSYNGRLSDEDKIRDTATGQEYLRDNITGVWEER